MKTFHNIQSDVEIAVYNLMIEMLGKESQLFFTTHNMELLDKRDRVYPEALIKRNNQSLKNSVEMMC